MGSYDWGNIFTYFHIKHFHLLLSRNEEFGTIECQKEQLNFEVTYESHPEHNF